MVNFMILKEKDKKPNTNWPQIFDCPYIILNVKGSGLGKPNALRNLINHQSDTDKIYLCTKDPCEVKYQLIINKRGSVGLNYSNDFIQS